MTPEHNSAFLVTSGGAHLDAADLSLYAMRLLDSDQSAFIANHIAHCAECRAEFARSQGDLALAAATVDLATPSVSARERLLAQVAREKKIVPATQVPGPHPEPRPVPVPTFGRSGSVLSMEERRPKRGTRLIVLTGIGWAAAALLCFAAGRLFYDRQNLRANLTAHEEAIARLNDDAASAHQLMDALTDPAAMRVSMRVPATPKPQGVPSGGVTYNPGKGTLIFLANNLPPLDSYKAYELWVIPADNSAPLPAGTFHPDDQGNGAVVMPDLPRGIPAKAFGVTIEPDGGSQTPTMPLIMFGN